MDIKFNVRVNSPHLCQSKSAIPHIRLVYNETLVQLRKGNGPREGGQGTISVTYLLYIIGYCNTHFNEE